MALGQMTRVRYVSRLDVLRNVLQTLASHDASEFGIMNRENLPEETTREYLHLLKQSSLIAQRDNGLYCITPSGLQLLMRWNEVRETIKSG